MINWVLVLLGVVSVLTGSALLWAAVAFPLIGDLPLRVVSVVAVSRRRRAYVGRRRAAA